MIFWVSRLPKLKGLFSSLPRELVEFFSASISQKHQFFSFLFPHCPALASVCHCREYYGFCYPFSALPSSLFRMSLSGILWFLLSFFRTVQLSLPYVTVGNIMVSAIVFPHCPALASVCHCREYYGFCYPFSALSISRFHMSLLGILWFLLF